MFLAAAGEVSRGPSWLVYSTGIWSRGADGVALVNTTLVVGAVTYILWLWFHPAHTDLPPRSSEVSSFEGDAVCDGSNYRL